MHAMRARVGCVARAWVHALRGCECMRHAWVHVVVASHACVVCMRVLAKHAYARVRCIFLYLIGGWSCSRKVMWCARWLQRWVLLGAAVLLCAVFLCGAVGWGGGFAL